ncbi:MAG: ParA family protein [Acidobacteriota bacterium]|nr:ParA family protein [Acidobacteriota bacterium]
MYITTFYSFKGGVGRTMALVNVAAELANRGKRVLIVDFDLEAPGLDTFDLGPPTETPRGIVDFVQEYLDSGTAPDASDFLFESSDFSDNGGRLWIMPSGSPDGSYPARLASIDWNDLYAQHDGYLLFEDLKLQWKAGVEPDYVLVDSRTGYTDVGGICTRHLPDAVVVLFFPNQQNLRGLTKVVSDIRAEKEGPREKDIHLHFVLSNVPDLDDEDAILEKMIRSFQDNLGFSREPLFIHRYASLSLLNQVIFTKERPRSRLARQYLDLASAIIRHNPADRQGALDYIARLQRDRPAHLSHHGHQDPQLERIQSHHPKDGEILFRLGRLQPSWKNALSLFDQSIETRDYARPQVYLARAELRRGQLDDRDGASQDALEVLRLDDVSPPDVYRALHLLLPEHWHHVPDSPALQAQSPSNKAWIADREARSTDEALAIVTILQGLVAESSLEQEETTAVRRTLVLALLALGRYSAALEVIQSQQPSLEEMQIDFAFNYSMALWGHQGEIERKAFAQVVKLDSGADQTRPDANYFQCLALSHWAVGNVTEAKERTREAVRAVRSERTSVSCWRYLSVPASTFVDDIAEMVEMIDGDTSVRPRFMEDPKGN